MAGVARTQPGTAPPLEQGAADNLPVARPLRHPASLAHDEAHWARVAALFPVERSVVNFEIGYFAMMVRPVAHGLPPPH